MLEIGRLRSEPEEVKAGLRRKGADPGDVDRVLALDERRRTTIASTEALKARKNEVSKEIGALKRGGGDTAALQAAMRAVGDRISASREATS